MPLKRWTKTLPVLIVMVWANLKGSLTSRDKTREENIGAAQATTSTNMPLVSWEVRHVSNGSCILEPNCGKTCCGKHKLTTQKDLLCPWNRSLIIRNNGDSKGITVSLMYYAHPYLLLKQLDHFASYPPHLRQDLTLLIVDDGSPLGLRAQDVVTFHHKQLYRIRIVAVLEDIPWNTPQARNLAFYNTDSFRVLMIDMDSRVPHETFELLREIRNTTSRGGRPHQAYQMNRVFPSGKSTFHPSATFLDVQGWWLAGGADEDFSGNYAFEDKFFWDNFERAEGKRVRRKDILLYERNEESYCESSLLSKSTQLACREHKNKDSIEKNGTHNKQLYRQKMKAHCWSNSFLRVPWKLLE